MKKLSNTFGVLLILVSTLLAQAPQSFKYQAIARDIEGNIISDQQISLRISMIQDNKNGNIVYSEIHTIKTNQFGLINLEIGKGINKIGEFSSINWGISKYFVQMEMDVNGGDKFIKMGVSQLLSVPYALYAENTGSSSKIATSPWETVGSRTYLKNLNSKLSIGTTKTPGKLTVNQDNNADALLVTGGGLGKNIASFIRDVGSNGRIDFNVCGADPQIKFDVEGGGTKWFIGVDDSPSDYFQIGFGGTTLSGSSRAITIDDVNGNVGIGTTNPMSDLDVHGTLQVENGTSINEISTDITLAGNSDDAVPTEKAVKAYIDALESRIQALLIPVLTTTDASAITYTTATSGGDITITGASAIMARGICWSTTTNPTIADSNTTDGPGPGTFTSQASGLLPTTTYFVRAYATNSVGTTYGNEKSFTTVDLPNLTTTATSSITYITATSGGNITSDGGGSVTARGVCWSTSTNPTITDSKTTDGIGTGVFTSSLSGLTSGTAYYARAYATTNGGTVYGNEISFTTLSCGNSFNDPRDGNSYNTVLIGNQCWMAENLAYLPQVDSVAEGSEDSPGKYYYVYGYTPTGATAAEEIANAKLPTTNYTTYGVLYNWTAAMDDAPGSYSNPSGVQGACPNGWHLPSDAEWTVLTDHLGGLSVAGGKMKEIGTTHWDPLNAGATNSSDFTALPGGYRYGDGYFYDMGCGAYFWSSTEYGTDYVWRRGLYCYSYTVLRSTSGKNNGSSVRCLRD